MNIYILYISFMNLNEYVNQHPRHERRALYLHLAKKLNVAVITIIQWKQQKRRPRPENAKKLEKETFGAVSRKDSRPDIFL